MQLLRGLTSLEKRKLQTSFSPEKYTYSIIIRYFLSQILMNSVTFLKGGVLELHFSHDVLTRKPFKVRFS